MDDHLDGFLERLQGCVAWAGSKRTLAKLTGISEAQLYRYLSGETPLPVDRLLQIARICTKEPGWLLTGEVRRYEQPPALTERPAFMPGLLMSIAEMMDQLLASSGRNLTPTQRARALVLIYESARLEGLRRGEPAFIDKSIVLIMLDFLTPLLVFDDLETYHFFIEILAKSPA
jgi:transcriptional regulator with XRE-family HTH domain